MSVIGCGVAGFIVTLIVALRFLQPSKLDAIPTVGSNSWLGSWWAGLKFLNGALNVIQEGYEKHKKAPFKIAALDRWMVILSSHEHVEELHRAPDDTLSCSEGVNEEVQIEYTMGSGIHHNPYHIPILYSQLTRNIGKLYPEIRSEVIIAFDDVLNLKGNAWKSVPALQSVQTIVCRTINRVFVGLPLCRDPSWIDLNIQYSIYVGKGASIIRLFPRFLKPLAARLFTKVVESNERGRKLLGPIIEVRQKYLNEYGQEWTEKPNDLLSWLMDEANGQELTVEALTTRILVNNFAAIHTTSTSLTNALFYLAANPQYIQPLREEVEAVIHKEGWSKASLEKMRKIDSFLKECQRVESAIAVSLVRKALKDFTFSDGTFVPKGTIIAAAAQSIHHDEAFYPNAHTFEPFRFADLRQDVEGGKHQFVSTTAEFLAFGHGRHACPGRFFAAVELKSMLAHVVVTYDIRLEDDAPRPETMRIGVGCIPDPNAKVMFRRRVK